MSKRSKPDAAAAADVTGRTPQRRRASCSALKVQTLPAVFVRGTPIGQPRPRAYVRPTGKAGVFDPGTSLGWKIAIYQACLAAKLPRHLMDPVSVAVDFFMPRPRRLGVRAEVHDERRVPLVPHVGTPDIDNLVKALMDALSNYGLWMDDRQVFSLTAAKYYAVVDGEPGATICICQWKERP